MTVREQLARLQLMSLLRNGEYRAVSNTEKLCRYTDCVEQNRVAADDEQVTCERCREYLGLSA